MVALSELLGERFGIGSVEASDTAGARAGADADTAELFNSAVAAFAIAAAWELGLLDRLERDGHLQVRSFCVAHELDAPSIRSVMTALAAVGVVSGSDDSFSVGPRFAGVQRHRAFFHWLTAGSGALFSAMPRIARVGERVGEFYRRDASAVAFACREINARSFDPVFAEAVAALDFDVRSVADLGCGSGARLAQIATRYPGVSGVGIDIAPDALRDAADHVRRAGLSSSFDFVCADVRDIEPDERFGDVDLITCFMMGHDFWPRDNCIATLRRLRRAFPGARRLLLGDTTRTRGISPPELPVFTLAFETAHDLMGVYLPGHEEWLGVFAEAGWRCLAARPVTTPAASYVYELAPLPMDAVSDLP